MKDLFFLICFLAIAQVSSAQNTYPWASSGNVGIGTTSPNEMLEISGGSGTSTRITSSSGSAYLKFKTSGSGNVRSIEAASDNKLYFNPTSGSPSLTIENGGNVGIGTTSPNLTLDVNGTANIGNSRNSNLSLLTLGKTLTSGFGTANTYLQLGAGENGVGSTRLIGFGYSVTANTSQPAYIGYIETAGNNLTKGDLIFGTRDVETDTAPTERIRVTSAGNVGIGTTDPQGYKLAVNGKIIAKEVKITLTSNSWPDYVFEPSYKLPDLKETEQFIKENKHLSEIPSAKEVELEGINLGEMNAKLLQKVEELTLHLIGLNRKVDILQQQLIK